jgi:hypothetical protein
MPAPIGIDMSVSVALSHLSVIGIRFVVSYIYFTSKIRVFSPKGFAIVVCTNTE